MAANMNQPPANRRCATAITFLLALTLGFAIVDLCVGIAYAALALTEPIEPHHTHRPYHKPNLGPYPTFARVIFFAITMPFISTILTVVHLTFHLRGTHTATSAALALGAHVFQCIGWVIQIWFWASCLGFAAFEKSGHICFQTWFGFDFMSDDYVGLALLCAGFTAACLLLVLVGVEGMRLCKARAARQRSERYRMERLDEPRTDTA